MADPDAAHLVQPRRRAAPASSVPRSCTRCWATLEPLPVPAELLVGNETGDDAAVYRLSEDQALVATLDFFTPIVDDPYDWGRIAATNALSDVYAMGGRPIFALNIVAWPVDDLPLEMLGEVLRGGRDVAGRRRHPGRGRPLDHRPGAEVRDGGARPRAPGPDRAQLRGCRPAPR